MTLVERIESHLALKLASPRLPDDPIELRMRGWEKRISYVEKEIRSSTRFSTSSVELSHRSLYHHKVRIDHGSTVTVLLVLRRLPFLSLVAIAAFIITLVRRFLPCLCFSCRQS